MRLSRLARTMRGPQRLTVNKATSIMSEQGTFEYRLPTTTFSSSKQHTKGFEDMVTRFLNAGFTLQGPPFIEGTQIYQPMIREKKASAPAPEVATDDVAGIVG